MEAGVANVLADEVLTLALCDNKRSFQLHYFYYYHVLFVDDYGEYYNILTSISLFLFVIFIVTLPTRAICRLLPPPPTTTVCRTNMER